MGKHARGNSRYKKLSMQSRLVRYADRIDSLNKKLIFIGLALCLSTFINFLFVVGYECVLL